MKVVTACSSIDFKEKDYKALIYEFMPSGSFAYPPDPTDGFVYQDECVNYLMQFAQPGLPIMFSLDNEPDLWSSTHAALHPVPVTYAELASPPTAYPTALKNW